MLTDPIVEEVRQVRLQIEAECKDDPQRYYAHLQEVQQKYRNRLVQRKPQPIAKDQRLAI